MGVSNEKFMSMLRETALDAIRKSFDVVLDKKYEIDNANKYFGTPTPTVIRSKVISRKFFFQFIFQTVFKNLKF